MFVMCDDKKSLPQQIDVFLYAEEEEALNADEKLRLTHQYQCFQQQMKWH